MADYKLLIGGDLVAGDQMIDVINPATEEVEAQAPRASAAQLEAAVAAAKRAFPAWAAHSVAERRAYLHRFAEAIDAAAPDLARILVAEQGKPLAQAEGELMFASYFIRGLAKPDLEPRILVDDDDKRIEVHRRALGVVAGISPWNYPLVTFVQKVTMALLPGNTLVMKLPPTTPLTCLKAGELAAEIFPAGVLNIITDLNDLGELLTSHPDVAKISFTGSTATGRKVMQSAAPSLKRLTLELGGNDAAIVLPDADPETVAQGLYDPVFLNAGQICISCKRVYAHEDIYDRLCDALARLAEATVVDSGMNQGAQMGPVQNKAQFDKLKQLLEEARAEGTVMTGGLMDDRPGYFIRPTIVRDIADGTRLVDEEQFGPILPVVRYSDVDEVIARVNASPYGLGGSIWSADEDKAHALAGRLEAGTVWVNQHMDFGPDVPFGGAKQSGIGIEFAEEGVLEFTQIQVVNKKKKRFGAVQ